MKEQIDVHILYSAQDYARAARYIQHRSLIFRYRYLFPVIVIAPVLIWQYLLDSSKFIAAFFQTNNLFVILFVPLIIVPILYLLSRQKSSFVVRRQFEKQIASSPAMQQPQRITFDHDGLEGQTILGSGNTQWAAVIEATETEDDFYFFTAKKFAIFVPKHVFDGTDQQGKLRRLVTKELGDRAKGLH